MIGDRIIGIYDEHHPGPLFICFGAMHGNEPAGVKAIELVIKMLEVENITNPGFQFHGRFIGILGNLKAFQINQRFISKDLNRQWTIENVRRIKQTPNHQLAHEDLEIMEILIIVEEQIKRYQPKEIIVLDLHTTTAYGGIFSIPTRDPKSIEIAQNLYAPVVQGLLKGIQGTVLHFFQSKNLQNIPTTTVCFESGQHTEALSVNRAIAAIVNCMKSIQCVKPEDVEHQHDHILTEYSKGLPKVSELIMKHTVREGDQFQMNPGYKNFQPIKKDEILAQDKSGPIRATEKGHILMPLYQQQGEDGFFLIKSIDKPFNTEYPTN